MLVARLLAYPLAAVGGLAAGLLGSFAHGYTAYGVPVGLVASLGLALAVYVTSGLLTRSRGGVLLAALGWLLVVLVLSQPRPEGDLVVPGSGLGYAWLLGGVVVAGAVAARPPSADGATGR